MRSTLALGLIALLSCLAVFIAAEPSGAQPQFEALEAAQDARTFRPEILRTCIRALKLSGPDVSFLEATKHIREQQRVLGRRLPKKAVGSPLLLKGLEGDVAVILNASDFDRDAAKNRKNLYVAMTRGSSKLVVCSPTHLLG